MNRIWMGVVVAVAVLLSGCDESSHVGVHRAALEEAPDDNIYTRAIAQEALGPDWVMVTESDFQAAVANTPVANIKEDFRSESFVEGLRMASAANEGWTSGVLAEQAQTGSIEGQLWIVVRDAQSTREGFAISSDYRLAFASLSFRDAWFASRLSFTKEVLNTGSARCCGPELSCETITIPPSPICGPNGYCGGSAYVSPGRNTGALEAANATGHLPHELTLFQEGFEVPTVCHSRLAPSCVNTNSMCGRELGADFTQNWDAPFPRGGSCGGDESKGGRDVPPMCLFANATTAGGFAAGAGRPADCDGRCFGCETGNGPLDQTLRPRQCDLMLTAGPGMPGFPGSGVCDSTPQSLIAEYNAFIIATGPSGKACEFKGDRGLEVCTTCVLGDGCTTSVRRAGVEVPPPQPGSTSQGSGGNVSGDGSRILVMTGTPAVQEGSGPPPAGVGMPNPLIAGGASSEEVPAVAVAKSPDSTKAADPISLSSGAFELQQTDIRIPGAVRPLEFTRTYDSRSNGRSALGSNWTHNWDVRIVALNDYNRPSWADPFCAGTPEGPLCVLLHVGATERLFTRDAVSGIFTPQAGVFSSITQLEGGGWRLVGADMHRMEFDSLGYLVLDVDRFDHGFIRNTPSLKREMALRCGRSLRSA